MAVYAGQGRQPFSAAQLLAMEEERKKQLAINQAKAKANEPIYFEKDRTWKDKLAGRKSLQGQYWEAYPESAPRGFWGDLAYRHGATSNLFGAPEMQMGNAGIWADEQIDRQEAGRRWHPQSPPYNPTVKVEESQTVLPGQTYPYDFSSGKQLSDEDFARTYQEGTMEASGAFKIPDWIPGLPNWIPGPYAYKQRGNTIDPELPFSEAIKTKEFWRGGIDELVVDAWNETRFGNTPGLFTSPGEWADAEITRQEEEQEAKRIAESDAGKAAVAREAGVWADREIDRQEAAQAAAKAAEMEAAGIWATDEIVRQEGEQLAARRAKEEEMRAAGIWADQQIDAQEASQAAAEASQAAAKAERMAAIQAGIDADAGRTTQENYELAAGIEWEKPSDVTAETIIETATAAADSYDADAANAEWVDKTMKGETLIGKFLDMLGIIGDNETVTEEGEKKPILNEGEANKGVEIVADLAEQSQVEAVTEVKQQDGLLATDVPAADAVVDTNVFTATAASTEGFTMDRLKNPLSPENKKWWLEQRPGDIPGNNRAVEFFNTLAYIGTPLKYRPSQTPSESLQDRRIKHMNNQLDYAASQTSTAPTFASLRAAVPSHQVIEDTIRGQVEAGADKGLLFGLIGGDDSDDIDNMIAEKATIIREKMLQMTLANNVIPSIQEAIDALSPPTTTTAPPPPPPGEGDGVIAKGVNWFSGLF